MQKHGHMWHKYVCVYFDMHIDVHTHVFASCAHICAQILTKICLVVHYSIISLSFKFHKDWPPPQQFWQPCPWMHIMYTSVSAQLKLRLTHPCNIYWSKNLLRTEFFMNRIFYKQNLLWTEFVTNRICYKQNLLWTEFVTNRICYEQNLLRIIRYSPTHAHTNIIIIHRYASTV